VNHSDIQSRMASYLDGELALGERALFDAHLDSCEPCSGELADMRATINLLRRLPTPEPPPDLVDQVMSRIAEGEGQPSWLGRVSDVLSSVFVPRFTIPATALAAGLAITFVSGDLQFRPLNSGSALGGPEVAALVPGLSGSAEQAAPARGQGGIQIAVQFESKADPTPRQLAPSSRQSQAPRQYARNQSGSGAFLYRVANEPLVPMRRQARDVAPDLLVRSDPNSNRPTELRGRGGSFANAPVRVGPYLGASAVTEQDLGIGVYQLQWGQSSEPVSTMARVASERPAGGSPATSLSAGSVASDSSGASAQSRTDRRREELDFRLRYLLQDPPGFAKQLSDVSLAERELWLRELATRAEEVGEFDRVKLALSSSGDPAAEELARGFLRAADQKQATWAEAEVPTAP
jgi:hypothetical protein